MALSDCGDGMVVGVGADSWGFALKEAVRAALGSDPRVKEVRDYGVAGKGDSTPYSSVGISVAEGVQKGELDRALLFCGTGIGMAISANKVRGVRATVAYDRYSVERSVLSNDCQILCLGGRVVTPENATRIVQDWLGYHFDPASRSAKKLEVISRYEAEHTVGTTEVDGSRYQKEETVQ